MRKPLIHLTTLCLGMLSSLAMAADSETDLLGGVEKDLTTLRENIAKKREAVAKAVNDASKAEKLKPSTAAYYMDALEKFTTPGGFFPEAERLYYPPRFDTSEEMEPINLAWVALKEEMQRVYTRTSEINSRYANAVSEELQRVARTAQKPEELAKLDQLLSAWEKVPESSPIRVGGANRTRDSLQRLASITRSVLEGLQRNDGIAIATAFGRVNQSTASGMELRSSSLPLRVDTFIEDFRVRVTAPIAQSATEAQREIEKGIIEGKPGAEVEKALASFQSSTTILDRIRNASRSAYTTFPERNQLVEAYRGTLTIMESLKAETADDSYQSVPAFGSDPNYPIGPEFRAFVSKLTSRMADHRRKASAMASAKQNAEERERQVALEKARQAAAETAIKDWRGKLAGVRSAQEALSLADEVPADPNREDRIGWTALAMELRSIARWWLDASLQSVAAQDTNVSDGYGRTHPFIAETRTLRERAMKDAVAKRLKLPQLTHAPLNDLGVREALEKLTDEAVARGDWRQVHDIVGVLALRDSTMSERLAALRSFLTAQNLETAGQYQAAATAYLQVIRTIGDSLPTKEAAERLKKIQVEHPEVPKAEQIPFGEPPRILVNPVPTPAPGQ